MVDIKFPFNVVDLLFLLIINSWTSNENVVTSLLPIAKSISLELSVKKFTFVSVFGQILNKFREKNLLVYFYKKM